MYINTEDNVWIRLLTKIPSLWVCFIIQGALQNGYGAFHLICTHLGGGGSSLLYISIAYYMPPTLSGCDMQ